MFVTGRESAREPACVRTPSHLPVLLDPNTGWTSQACGAPWWAAPTPGGPESPGHIRADRAPPWVTGSTTCEWHERCKCWWRLPFTESAVRGEVGSVCLSTVRVESFLRAGPSCVLSCSLHVFCVNNISPQGRGGTEQNRRRVNDTLDFPVMNERAPTWVVF